MTSISIHSSNNSKIFFCVLKKPYVSYVINENKGLRIHTTTIKQATGMDTILLDINDVGYNEAISMTKDSNE